MHGQLLALRKLVQLLDPPLHAFMAAKSSLNYFFCYRWLLIHFKREFAFDEVSVLWGFKYLCTHMSDFTVSTSLCGQLWEGVLVMLLCNNTCPVAGASHIERCLQ